MNKYLTEFIGTFFLVFVIGLTAVNGLEVAPLAIGSVLMVMVFMGGHVSGAHYNPAVTVAVFLRGKMPARDIAPYMIAQVAAALAAAAAVSFIMGGKTFAPAPGGDVPVGSALAVEVLFTFALALVVLNVATAKGTANNSFYGLAIGFTITAAAFAGGPVSGGAFNPAVGLGPILMKALAGEPAWGPLWLYLVGPIAGGALAAGVFRVQNPDDKG